MNSPIEIINEGAILIAQGSHQEGFDRTKVALDWVLLALRLAPSSNSDEFDMRTTPLRRQVEGDGLAFLHPFLVDSQDVDPKWNRLLPVIVFNMAVAFHGNAFAVDSSDHVAKRQVLLRKAKSLYEQALASCETLGTKQPCAGSALALVYTAILNNMIEVELQTTGNREKVEVLKFQLRSAFAELPAKPTCPYYQHFEEACICYCLQANAAEAA